MRIAARIQVALLTLVAACDGGSGVARSPREEFTPMDAGQPTDGSVAPRDAAGMTGPGVDDGGTHVDAGLPQDAGRDADAQQPSPSSSKPWVVSFRTLQGMVVPGDMVVVADGSIYVTATVLGKAVVEGTDGVEVTVPPANVTDKGLLAKFDARGVLQWSVMLGGNAGSANGLVALTNGDVVVTGLAAEGAAFHQVSQSPFASAGPQDGIGPFLARYSPEGKALWVVRGGGEGWNYGKAVAATKEAIYLVGQLRDGVARLGSSIGDGQTVAGTRNGSGFLARYTLDGELEWAVGNGGSESTLEGVAATDDAVYVGGDHRFFNTFTGTTGMPVERSSKNTYEDAYVARYGNDGSLDWLATIGASTGPSWSRVYDLSVSDDDRPVVFARGAGPLSLEGVVGEGVTADTWSVIAGYSPEGTPTVLRAFGDMEGVPEAIEWKNGTLWAGGWYNDDVTFQSASGGVASLQLTDSVDGFVIGYDAAGDIELLHSITGAGWQDVAAVVATETAVHFMGNYVNEATLLGAKLQGHPKDKSLFMARAPR